MRSHRDAALKGMIMVQARRNRTAPERTPATWRNRIVGSGEERPDQLLANPANWRIHPGQQQKALAGSLDVVGWVQQVMVNRRTNHVVDGHARVSLAISRNEPSVPVLYVDLEPDEEALVLASLDPISAMAATDDAQLQALLAGIETDNEGLRALLAELAGAGPKDGLTDPDDIPEPPGDPYVKPGEMWQLGPHRLLCGDATKADDVARVLGGERPTLTVTDPPYGVEYDASWRRKLVPGATYREGKVANDDRADWSEAMALMPGDVAYVWHGGLHAGVVAGSLATAGFDIRSQIVWTKPSLILSRGAYHWQHEPAWFAVRKGATAHWIGDRKQSTVWDIPTVHRTAGTSDDAITDHSTQKPVECMARPLRNHEGDVYDPFVGSGTTLIAAEQTGRRCFAIEIDPVYVQMSIERWQNFTGRQAVRL
jgi:DNA modification methylase